MKRIFITGATGYLGQRLALNLAGEGHVIHALVRDMSKAGKLLNHTNIKLFPGSILNSLSLQSAMRGCDEAYHLAALASVWNKDSTLFDRLNVDGLQNVLECCISLGIRKGFLKAMKYAKPGERYLLGGDNVLFLSYLQLGIANTLGKHPLITPPFVRKYSKNWLISSEKASSELEYSITPLKVGLQKTLSWLQTQN